MWIKYEELIRVFGLPLFFLSTNFVIKYVKAKDDVSLLVYILQIVIFSVYIIYKLQVA